MDINESLSFAQERLDKISYNLEMTNKLPCRPFYEKQQDMLIKAISSMKKQIPKKPVERQINPRGELIGLCSNCEEWWINKYYNFCPNCGQKLDWSENDGTCK
ncbi:MAG: hypothetical protein ACQGTM_15525 [bacterium]